MDREITIVSYVDNSFEQDLSLIREKVLGFFLNLTDYISIQDSFDIK